MNLTEYARNELAYAFPEHDEMQELMNNDMLELIKTFSQQGHSGFSANYATNIVTKLMQYKPLSPLTGESDEWLDRSEYDFDSSVLQNKRYFSVFKDIDGKVYDSNAVVFVEPSGSAFTNIKSKRYIKFPYTPKTEYVRVPFQPKNLLEQSVYPIYYLYYKLLDLINPIK